MRKTRSENKLKINYNTNKLLHHQISIHFVHKPKLVITKKTLHTDGKSTNLKI